MANAAPDAAHAAGGSFPPFDVTTFPSQIFWFAITFGVLYFTIAKVIAPRLGDIIATRRNRIESDLSAAQKAKDDSDAASAAYEKSLADARARAQALAADNHAKVVAASEANRKTIEEGLNARLAEAEAKIAKTKAAAMANVEGIAADTASSLVEKLIGTAPKAADLTKAVATALKG